MKKFSNLRNFRDFSGSPAVKTSCFQYRGHGSIPGWGTNIPHATLHSQKHNNRNFPGGSVVKNQPANVRDMGLIPGLGGSHMPQRS